MNNLNYIPQKELDKIPKSISIEQMDIIKRQMQTCICKIICPTGGFGTGFFCKIYFPDEFHLLPVLMTNNHVLNENDIKSGNSIIFTLNNEELRFKIMIDNERKTYTNSAYDITIIELKQNDGLFGYSFLEIDYQTFINENNSKYKNKSVYLIHYPHGNKVEYSLGIIKGINVDNYTIEHLCFTINGSSGGPILNLLDYKVIGIHKGCTKNKNWNLGTLITKAIEAFYENQNLKTIIQNNIKKHNINNLTNNYLNFQNVKMGNNINQNNMMYQNNKFFKIQMNMMNNNNMNNQMKQNMNMMNNNNMNNQIGQNMNMMNNKNINNKMGQNMNMNNNKNINMMNNNNMNNQMGQNMNMMNNNNMNNQIGQNMNMMNNKMYNQMGQNMNMMNNKMYNQMGQNMNMINNNNMNNQMGQNMNMMNNNNMNNQIGQNMNMMNDNKMNNQIGQNMNMMNDNKMNNQMGQNMNMMNNNNMNNQIGQNMNMMNNNNMNSQKEVELNKKIEELSKNLNEMSKKLSILKDFKSESESQSLLEENLFSIIFVSADQKVHYSIVCKNSDPFYKVEQKLYEEYPELKEKDLFFLNNGKSINRNKTVAENKIKNGYIITIFEAD